MYKRLDNEQYTKLRRELLKKEGSALQTELLEAVRTDASFLKFMRDRVGTKGEEEASLLHEKLTEHQYKDPTKDTSKAIYKTWKDVPPETACRVTFWGEVTLLHIESKCIRSSYLAANGGSLPGGLERIDKALSSRGSEKEIDSCVRAILRRMSGLPEARGNISVYVNCPFACAWWREQFAEEVCSNTEASRDMILNLLRSGQEYWETLVRLVVSRNSILGDRVVRDALIWSLSVTFKTDKENRVFKAQKLKDLCRLLGVRCAWQELGIFKPIELKVLIDKEILSMVQEPAL